MLSGNYWDTEMSVVRRRPSSVVCRVSSTIACEHDRDHIFDPIFKKLGQNVCLHESLVPFESGSSQVKN